MSPQWANVMGYGLYFYYGERHQRPHVEVRGAEGRATVDINTGEVLAGAVPPRVERAVRRFLAQHRETALEAFAAALAHHPPGRLEASEDRDV